MFQMHVVNSANRHLYVDELRDYFRLRYEAFTIERRWFDARDDGLENDEFDTDAATHLIGIQDGRVMCTTRMIPTSEPNLVSEHFAHMCDLAPPPRRPDWADWTRGAVAKEYRSDAPDSAGNLMSLGAMEFCVEEGIEYVGGLMALYFQTRWAERRWRTRPFGLPRDVAGYQYLVTYARCDEEALQGVRDACRTQRSVLVRRGEPRPFIGPNAGVGVSAAG